MEKIKKKRTFGEHKVSAMEFRKYILAGFTTMFCFVGGFTQETLNTTGNEASGSGGSVSYSVGQVVYSTNANGTEAQGVQHPFELLIISGVEVTNIKLDMMVYPNPTSDILILKSESNTITSLTYQLYDIQGKLIDSNKGASPISIDMNSFKKGTYLLNVIVENKKIKTYKIIKN